MANFRIQPCGNAALGKLGRQMGITEHCKTRTKLDALLEKLFKLTMSTKGKSLITVRMTPDHVQRTDANRAGRTEYGDVLHGRAHRAANNSQTRATTGSVEVRLSMRSSTPP